MECKDSPVVETNSTSVVFNDCSKKCEREAIPVDYSRTSQEIVTTALRPVSSRQHTMNRPGPGVDNPRTSRGLWTFSREPKKSTKAASYVARV